MNEEEAKDYVFSQFLESCDDIEDLVLLILRFHLYIEYLLESIIQSFLPRADKLIDKGNLSFHQKIAVVESFDYVDDEIITSLRHLNKVRNQCAHEMKKNKFQ